MLTLNLQGMSKVKKAIEDAPDRGLLMVQKIAMDLYQKVIIKSPVDSGRFRSNWQFSINRPITTPILTGGSKGLAPIKALTEIPKSIWLSNNLPYSRVIEYGLFTTKPYTIKTVGGYSKQAPRGVARISLDEVKARFQ